MHLVNKYIEYLKENLSMHIIEYKECSLEILEIFI